MTGNLNGTGLCERGGRVVRGILYPSCISERAECSAVCRLAVKTALPYLCWAKNPQILALAFLEKEGLEGGTQPIDPWLRASPRPGPAVGPEGCCIGLGALLETEVHSFDANLYAGLALNRLIKIPGVFQVFSRIYYQRCQITHDIYANT